MNLKELRILKSFITDYYDFFTSNADADESGLYEETLNEINEVNKILEKYFYKIHLRNALAKIKRRKLINAPTGEKK